MRLLKSPRQLLAAVIAGVLAGGCSDLLSKGVPIPDGNSVAEFDVQLDPGLLRSEAPYETIVVGVAYVDRNCETFFNAVESLGHRLIKPDPNPDGSQFY